MEYNSVRVEKPHVEYGGYPPLYGPTLSEVAVLRLPHVDLRSDKTGVKPHVGRRQSSAKALPE